MNDLSSPVTTMANQAAWDAFCDQFLLEIQPEQVADQEVTAVQPARVSGKPIESTVTFG